MTRITVALVALLAVACGGEGDKKDSPAGQTAPPAADPGKPAAPGAAAPAAPDPAAPPAVAPPAATLPPGMPSLPPGSAPPGMPGLAMLGGAADLNTPTGIAECDQVFAYVRDRFLTCEKIPQAQRDLMKTSMAGMNMMIRRGLQASTPEMKARLVDSCTKGLAEARKDYEEHCK